MLGCEAYAWLASCSVQKGTQGLQCARAVCSAPSSPASVDGALVWTGLHSSEVCVPLVVPVQGRRECASVCWSGPWDGFMCCVSGWDEDDHSVV